MFWYVECATQIFQTSAGDFVMMKAFTYLAIDIACIVFPLLFSFHPKFPFYRHWRQFFAANMAVALFFLLWDMLFTYLGVWGFNPDYLLGWYVFNLPLEEVLFFVCIPYACVFSYYAISRFVPMRAEYSWHRWVTVALLLITALGAILYFPKLYTTTTCVFVALLLWWVWWQRINMGGVYLAYLFVFPFFWASNGVLTGSGLDAPVVWYNDAENIGLRLRTIPIKDTLYGFLMIALNILLSFYDHLKK